MYERHGKRWTRAYHTWLQIKDRCLNPRNAAWRNYGGRGIHVSERWKNSFSAFYEDMGDPPVGHSIDRINNDGDYCKENCRWATQIQQANNTRQNRIIVFRGRRRTLAQWCREFGIPCYIVTDRLSRGWTTEDAFTTPIAHWNPRTITSQGKTQSLSEWSRETGLSVATIFQRLDHGWDVDRALSASTDSTWRMITYQGETLPLAEWSRRVGISRITIRRRLARGLSLEEALSPRDGRRL